MKKWIALAVLVIGMVLTNGCTSSPPESAVIPESVVAMESVVTRGNADPPSPSMDDFEKIQQGIDKSQEVCSIGLRQGDPPDKCTIHPLDRNRIGITIIRRLDEKEHECLILHPLLTDPGLCSVKDEDKIMMGTRVGNRYLIWRMLNMKESIDDCVDAQVDELIALPYAP